MMLNQDPHFVMISNLVVTILAARNYQVNVLEMCVALGGAAAVR